MINHKHVVAKAMARLVAKGTCRHTMKNGKPAIEMIGDGDIEKALVAECEKIARGR